MKFEPKVDLIEVPQFGNAPHFQNKETILKATTN